MLTHVESLNFEKYLWKCLDPGCLTFSLPRIEVNVDTGIAKIEVKRINGKDGKVGCFWNTMEISAKANQHFVDTKGMFTVIATSFYRVARSESAMWQPCSLKIFILGMVLFDDGEDLQVIEVPLISSSKFEEFVEFKVVLIEPQGKCSLGNNQKENISKILSILLKN